MEIALWAAEEIPPAYVDGFKAAVRRAGHTVRLWRTVEAVGQQCERERQREGRSTGVLLIAGNLPSDGDYSTFRSRHVVDALLRDAWPAHLHYLIAILDLKAGLEENVIAVDGTEVSWGLGKIRDVDAFAESAWASLSQLFALIDEWGDDSAATYLPSDFHLLPPGATFRGARGSYRDLRQLGRGGTAEVYEVEDESHAHYAAKLLSAHRFDITPAVEARFAREVAALRGISHPNIVSVVDEGTYAATRVLVMELLHGSLHDRFQSKSRHDARELLAWAEGALRALEVLHASGVIHRDVSPKNLLLRGDGRIVLADFGTTRNVLDVTVTQPEEVMGSMLYISPQQFESAHSATASDDLYSLGQVLWEAASGQRPFRTTHPLRVIRPDLPAEFAGLVDQMRSDVPRYRPTATFALARLEHVKQNITRGGFPTAAHADARVTRPSTQRSSFEGDESLFDAVGHRPSPDVVRQALLRAEEGRIVSRRMPRVPLFGMPYLARFVPVPEGGAASTDVPKGNSGLRVVLEQANGDVFESFDWSGAMTAVDLCEAIGIWFVEHHRYPGDGPFHPRQMFDDLQDLLRRAHRAASDSEEVAPDLAPVVQLLRSTDGDDHWWITDAGIQRGASNAPYTVTKERLDETDWNHRVAPLPGLDPETFRQALDTARALRDSGLL